MLHLHICLGGLRSIAIVLLVVFTIPAFASVKYQFIITEQPAGDFFKPLVAEIVLSDTAVSAGLAQKGQVESIVVSGGPTMQEANRITLTYLHGDFKDITVTLSADRSTITSIGATIGTSGAPIDYWVFHYQRPVYPGLDIHEFLGYIRPDAVTLETTILPVPPTTHYDRFVGHWQRVRTCWLCRYSFISVSHWRFCWLDWLVVIVAIAIPAGIFWRLKKQ